MPDDRQVDAATHRGEIRWSQLAKACHRIPIIGRLPTQALSGLLACGLAILLAVLFPQKNCTCKDQFTDEKLEAVARQGNQAAVRYLAQTDNPINCAGRRLELLRELRKEESKGHLKQLPEGVPR